jgi:AbrB family looped-hinge helix DNA binding protein
VHNPIEKSEPEVALEQVDAHAELHEGVSGADKAYHQADFVTGCRERDIRPHVACKEGGKVKGLDGRTTASNGYRTSLIRSANHALFIQGFMFALAINRISVVIRQQVVGWLILLPVLGIENGIVVWYNANMLMRSTIDKAGRVVIPKELRDALHLEAGDLIEVETSGDSITLRAARDDTPLVKREGVWIHRGSGQLTAEEVNHAIAQSREERERRASE